jgi:hypothetical protein
MALEEAIDKEEQMPAEEDAVLRILLSPLVTTIVRNVRH